MLNNYFIVVPREYLFSYSKISPSAFKLYGGFFQKGSIVFIIYLFHIVNKQLIILFPAWQLQIHIITCLLYTSRCV